MAKRVYASIPYPERETPLSFASLARRLRLHRQTIWRWTTHGTKLGVTLETMQLGDRRVTSEEAYKRFCRRQQEVADAKAAIAPAVESGREPPKPNRREYTLTEVTMLKAAGLWREPKARSQHD